MKIRIAVVLATLLVLFVIAVPANAQSIVSATSATSLNLTVAESLTVSATPSSINFTGYSPSAGTATASAPIVVVTTGNLNPGHVWLVTWGYLGSATAALAGPSNIPSSNVFASVNGGAAAPCTYNASGSGQFIAGVVNGAACPTSVGATAGNGPIGGQQNPPSGAYSQTDTVALTLSGAANLAPGNYSGILTFVAGAF